jgi:Uma2 family endonuclease
MNAVLEVPAIRERVLRFSVEDYHRITDGQPTELLRGTIIQKTAKSFLHGEITRRLFKILETETTFGRRSRR